MQAHLRWSGHVIRMPDYRLPKKLLYGELQHGKRSQGRPKLRYKDGLKATLKAFSIKDEQLEGLAVNRDAWRATVHKGAASCEADRIKTAEQRRQKRKDKANDSASAATIPCPKCNRKFKAKIGLISHLRTHRT